jgi:hypothetical protein
MEGTKSPGLDAALQMLLQVAAAELAASSTTISSSNDGGSPNEEDELIWPACVLTMGHNCISRSVIGREKAK